MRRFRRSFRAKRRFSRTPVLRAARRTSQVNVVDSTATATTDGIALITTPATIDEDPDHTIITNGTAIAEVEEGSKITGVDLTMELAGPPDTAPYVVSFLVWKDSAFGALTAPTTAADVLQPATTLQLKELKANACHFERFLITEQSDKRRFKLHIPRRLRTLKQGEGIKISVSNGAPNVTINWIIFGRIFTIR